VAARLATTNVTKEKTQPLLGDEAAAEARYRKESFGDQGALTLLEQAAQGATFGGYGAVANAINPETAAMRAGRSEENPGYSAVGTGIGLVVPAVLSGGTSAIGSAAKALPADCSLSGLSNLKLSASSIDSFSMMTLPKAKVAKLNRASKKIFFIIYPLQGTLR